MDTQRCSPTRRKAMRRFLPATATSASSADASDCFETKAGLHCLPGLVNIGVQKAGTGELQNWLAAHPSILVHGGEVHFFDGMRPAACSARHRGPLRLKYARFLWRRRGLKPADVKDKLLFEKTPAYFDRAPPKLIACAVPSARLLVMLRAPAERARSAYAMCQRELGAPWCRAPFEEALARVLTLGGSTNSGRGNRANGTAAPRANRRALRHEPHLRRMLLMGHYAAFLRRWLEHFPPARLRVLWLEQFKRDPFACMAAVERFAELPSHDYRSIATRNAAGLYVVGKSKSSSAATSGDAAAAAASKRRRNGTQSAAAAAAFQGLRAYYSPWQRRLRELVHEHNLTLLAGSEVP